MANKIDLENHGAGSEMKTPFIDTNGLNYGSQMDQRENSDTPPKEITGYNFNEISENLNNLPSLPSQMLTITPMSGDYPEQYVNLDTYYDYNRNTQQTQQQVIYFHLILKSSS